MFLMPISSNVRRGLVSGHTLRHAQSINFIEHRTTTMLANISRVVCGSKYLFKSKV